MYRPTPFLNVRPGARRTPFFRTPEDLTCLSVCVRCAQTLHAIMLHEPLEQKTGHSDLDKHIYNTDNERGLHANQCVLDSHALRVARSRRALGHAFPSLLFV